jgi:hypothetical protein
MIKWPTTHFEMFLIVHFMSEDEQYEKVRLLFENIQLGTKWNNKEKVELEREKAQDFPLPTGLKKGSQH